MLKFFTAAAAAFPGPPTSKRNTTFPAPPSVETRKNQKGAALMIFSCFYIYRTFLGGDSNEISKIEKLKKRPAFLPVFSTKAMMP